MAGNKQQARTRIKVLPFILLSAAIVFCGTSTPPGSPPSELLAADPVAIPPIPARGFYMGMLPMPADNQSLEAAYALAARNAEFVPVWGKPSPYYELAGDLQGGWGDIFLRGLTWQASMFPLVHMSFIDAGITLKTPPDLTSATLSDPAWRAGYKQAAIDIISTGIPMYLSLGNEVNRWYEQHGAAANDPNGFQHFVSLYEETYDAVKALSPETIVFCVFSREIVDENREADLEVLRMFDPEKLDLLIFTSYAVALPDVSHPSDLPDDYFARAAEIMPGKPIGFSELGWMSIEALGGEQAQAEFLRQVAGRLTQDQGLDLHMLAWIWLTDLDENDHTGLIARDGTEKLGYQAWKDLSESGE